MLRPERATAFRPLHRSPGALAAALLFAIGCGEPPTIDPSVPITPIEIGAAQLERADGSTIDLDGWRGRPFVLHFWASFCAPCRRELPVLLAADRRVLAVSVDAEWSDVRRFFGRTPMPSQVVREADGAIARTLGVSSLPDTYVIDARGRALRRVLGARDWNRPELAAWLHATLRER